MGKTIEIRKPNYIVRIHEGERFQFPVELPDGVAENFARAILKNDPKYFDKLRAKRAGEAPA